MASTAEHPNGIWLRPGLRIAALADSTSREAAEIPLPDAALFDVDGVLIDTRRSYRLSVIHASEYIVRVLHGLRDAPSPLVTQEDVARFKLAGGFNSDWDATQLFAALWTARLREWRGRPEARMTMDELAEQAHAAAQSRRGGTQWLRATVPHSAIPDDEVVRWVHDEFYWGAALVRELYGHEPLYAPEAPGYVHNEELLLEPELLPGLAAMGIASFGLITGRVGSEVGWAVRRLATSCGLAENASTSDLRWHDSEHGKSPFGCIVPATQYAKPDPRALAFAVRALGSRAALYVGDTADDLDLVLRYRQDLQSVDTSLPPVLAVSVARGAEALTYQSRGADIVLDHVRDVPAALAMLTR